MTSRRRKPKAAEFGDFQTPHALARQVCKLLANRGLDPATVIEPTCGTGNFLLAALDQFPKAKAAFGADVNPSHLEKLRALLGHRADADKVRVVQESFFVADWTAVLRHLPEPTLVIGNPPWVTNAQLGTLGSRNLPKKTNFQNHRGMDAITGKSNFDISEWMLIRLLELLDGRRATLAMLCKTSVARKVLKHAWANGCGLDHAETHGIDAATWFGAAVDACLLVCVLGSARPSNECRVFRRLGDERAAATFGHLDGRLIADIAAYRRWKHLDGEGVYPWRSGIKHDCADVMEFCKEGSRYRNGLGEVALLEEACLYPMLKGSQLVKGRAESPRRWMLVPQKTVKDDTSTLRGQAPKTWKYLQDHGAALDRRASSIYRNRPRFSVFGIGPYSFAPWKVAIAGFGKKLQFTVVGLFAGKPVVLDDTTYFVSCQSEPEARYLASLLNSSPAQEFFSAFVFWDAKRPITLETLRRLDLPALARELGSEDDLRRILKERSAEGPDYALPIFALSAE